MQLSLFSWSPSLSLSVSSAHYYGRHIALINGAECVRLNFQFACNDLIVHNFVIWLTQIPLNDNDFMQFMGRACRATDPRPVRTCNKQHDKPGQAGQMRRVAVDAEHDSQLIHYQLHVIYVCTYICMYIYGLYMYLHCQAELSRGHCFLSLARAD